MNNQSGYLVVECAENCGNSPKKQLLKDLINGACHFCTRAKVTGAFLILSEMVVKTIESEENEGWTYSIY